MTFLEKLHQGTPTLSFEFYPPKNSDGWGTLYQTLGSISRRSPDYVTVTYGAGGGTRRKTIDLVGRIQDELGIEAMAHLTCVGHSREELFEILCSLQAAGIKYIMALRGDPPTGQSSFVAHQDGFAYASELIAFIKANFDFHIGCSFYPEKHPEAVSLERDIEVLKLKQDVGADFAVSQNFFDNSTFYAFRPSGTCGSDIAISRRVAAGHIACSTGCRRYLPPHWNGGAEGFGPVYRLRGRRD
jgi:methylenetetrahydrofolate reductase (NADPH)